MNTQTIRSPAARDNSLQESHDEVLNPKRDLINYVRDYAKENPGITAAWCVGIGFILGWKLKPW